MSNEILPIGTMVILKNKPHLKFVITGYRLITEDGEQKDYAAVLYPIGLISNESFFGINRSDIAEVIHMGYTDSLFEAFKKRFFQVEQTETEQADTPNQE